MDVTRRLAEIRAAAFPPDQAQRLLEIIWRNPQAIGAAEAARELVPQLPTELLDRLVGEIVAPFAGRGSRLNEFDYHLDGAEYLVSALSELRVGVQDAELGWIATLPSGTELNAPYRNIGDTDLIEALPARDAAMTRLALSAVLLLRIEAS